MLARGQHSHCLTWAGGQDTQSCRQTQHQGRLLKTDSVACPLKKECLQTYFCIANLFTNSYIGRADQTLWPFGQPSWSNALVSRVTVPKSNHGLANVGQRLWSAQSLSYLDRRTGHPVMQTDPAPWKMAQDWLTSSLSIKKAVFTNIFL